MSHGLPDFYRGVDIAYQALAQLIIRPKYGGGIVSSGSTVVTASSITNLVTVSGKGMIYGGVLFLTHTSTQKNSWPVLRVDGKLLVTITFNSLNIYGINNPRSYPLTLLKFDDANFIYCGGFSYGISFETELKLQYEEGHGTTPAVNYRIVYALI